MVEYFCCPPVNASPDNLIMTQTIQRYRQVLKLFAYGEIGAIIGHIYLFGVVAGLFQSVHMWIDFMAYASLTFCATLSVVFISGLSCIMLFMNGNDGAEGTEAVSADTLALVVYYACFAYAGFKGIVSFKIYQHLKKSTLGLNQV